MSNYLKPLGVFVGGQLLLLVMWLLLSSIGAAGDTLAANTADIAPTFWGWSWASSSTKLVVVITGELLVLFATFKAFLSTKG